MLWLCRRLLVVCAGTDKPVRLWLPVFGWVHARPSKLPIRPVSSSSWTCVVSVPLRTAASPEQAPLGQLPELGDISCEIITRPDNGRVGVGLRLRTDRHQVRDILKNGRPVTAQILIRNADGRKVAVAVE